jgi:hypothetical protein
MRNGRKRSKIRLLSLRLLRVPRASRDDRGEVANPVDCVAREQASAERVEIQPLMGRSAEASVIQVEAIDINVRDHD